MAKLNKLHPDGSREFKESGSRIECIMWKKDGTFKKHVKGGVPTVGGSMLVGSVSARSYSNQDYWLTTPITEIIELKYNKEGLIEYCLFKTENSRYELIG